MAQTLFNTGPVGPGAGPYMKQCSTCGVEKPGTDFYPQKGRTDGLTSDCKTCRAVRSDTQYRRLTEAQKVRRREYARVYRFTKTYGITPMEYDTMLDTQDGVCALCGRPETRVDPRTGKVYGLAVDHDHLTHQVRSLLCHSCNLSIGRLQDDPDLLRRAADYIELHRVLDDQRRN